MNSHIKTTKLKRSKKIQDSYEEIVEWLELKHKYEAKEFIKELKSECDKLKGLFIHKQCDFDSLKIYGEYCKIIKPKSTKCYVIYNVVNNTIIIEYIKPCSQAYDY